MVLVPRLLQSLKKWDILKIIIKGTSKFCLPTSWAACSIGKTSAEGEASEMEKFGSSATLPECHHSSLMGGCKHWYLLTKPESLDMDSRNQVKMEVSQQGWDEASLLQIIRLPMPFSESCWPSVPDWDCQDTQHPGLSNYWVLSSSKTWASVGRLP